MTRLLIAVLGLTTSECWLKTSEGRLISQIKQRSRLYMSIDSSYLHLSPETLEQALDEVRTKYGNSVFYQDESLRMSGGAEIVDVDGCGVTLRLTGTFWHQREVVFDLVARYLTTRIPEICEVVPFSSINLEDNHKQAPDFNGDRYELERLGYEAGDTVVINHRPGLTFTGYNI